MTYSIIVAWDQQDSSGCFHMSFPWLSKLQIFYSWEMKVTINKFDVFTKFYMLINFSGFVVVLWVYDLQLLDFIPPIFTSK